MIKTRLDEGRTLNLVLEMQGVRGSSVPEVRFSIDTGSYTVSVPGKRNPKGEGFRITLPNLEGVVPHGTHDYVVEAFLDGRHFPIDRGEIWFEEPVHVGLTEMNEEEREEISFSAILKDSEAPEKTISETVRPHAIARKGTLRLPR